LSAAAGVDLLLEDGAHFVGYDDAKDCFAAVRSLLDDPTRARHIAEAGKAAYEERLAPERIVGDFFALVERGVVRPEFDVMRDRRLSLGQRSPLGMSLKERVHVYEVLHQIHLTREMTRVVTTPAVDPRLIADLTDLPRLMLSVDMTTATDLISRFHDFLSKADLDNRVAIIAREFDRPAEPPDIVLGTSHEWYTGLLRGILERYNQAMLLLTGVEDDAATIGALTAADYRPTGNEGVLFTMDKVNATTRPDTPDPARAQYIAITLTSTDKKTLQLKAPNDGSIRFVLKEIFEGRCYPIVADIGDVRSILDVGANVGLAAGHFRSHYPAAKIYCVEPDLRAFSYLRANATVIGNCEVYNVGLWDCDCTQILNLGASTVLTSALGKETGAKASIQCLGSAKFCSGIGTIDVLKIDTEGAEVPILWGMRQLLADIKVIYLEFHSHMDRCVIDVLLSETHAL
jgi:FkbM family methyltransferase